MGPEDAVPKHCPHCGRTDRIVRAADARPNTDETAPDGVDVALPAYESWSVLLMGALALLFIGALATGGAAAPGTTNPSPAG